MLLEAAYELWVRLRNHKAGGCFSGNSQVKLPWFKNAQIMLTPCPRFKLSHLEVEEVGLIR